MIMCSLTWATHNLRGKQWEVKRKGDSIKKGYHLMVGRVLQGVTYQGERIEQGMTRPAAFWKSATGNGGSCRACQAALVFVTAEAKPPCVSRTVPVPAQPDMFRNNFVLGHFELDGYVDVYVHREKILGREDNCACAFLYDERQLRTLFESWKPAHGEKRRCIKHLCDFAWRDSRGGVVSEYPGWLRAHKINDPRRFMPKRIAQTEKRYGQCNPRQDAVIVTMGRTLAP